MKFRFVLLILMPFAAIGNAADPVEEAADRKVIERLVKEAEPPPFLLALIKHNGPQTARQMFAKTALKPYLADRVSADEVSTNPATHPLGAAVLHAAERLQQFGRDDKSRLIMEVRAPTTAAIKKNLMLGQRGPARIMSELEEIAEQLDKASEQRATESSPYWQAHFDLLHARLLLWRAALHEYALMLGQVRRDALPELDTAKGHNGWRLASVQKMQSNNEVKQLARDAIKEFMKIEKRYHGTPWATLAQHDRTIETGLEWQLAALPSKK